MDNIHSNEFATRRSGETEEQHRERIVKANKEEFAKKEQALKSDTSTDLGFDVPLFFRQINDLEADITANYGDMNDTRTVPSSAKEEYELRFGYLNETSKTMFRKLVEKQFPDKMELLELKFFLGKIPTGELTRYEASQAYSEYRLKRKMKIANNMEHINRDDAWDLLRSKNSWGNTSNFYDSDDDSDS